jgi:Histidine kinase-, DNA gyrase B-, and HSP90-like ATPase
MTAPDAAAYLDAPPGPVGLVVLEKFILAIRDAGYRGTAAALAELIDNAFEADASTVDISLRVETANLIIEVRDNGHGMSPEVLQLALRFGGSTRFGSRLGSGRFGMGLPNASISQARRLDVFSWQCPGHTWWAYLDIDEVTAGKLTDVPAPKPVQSSSDGLLTSSGTVVVWSKCDRVDCSDVDDLRRRLARSLGRIFRHQLWQGRQVRIDGTPIGSVDPLFVHAGAGLSGGELIGPPLQFEVRVPRTRSSSMVTVLFSRLPIAEWERFTSAEKRSAGISKGAGVSIVRAGREIDAGWFFMGRKRRENYDDWWRCEVQFEPQLDEQFGVTHTKQGIHPTDQLRALLSPDLECVAHQLNAEVRRQFTSLRPSTLAAKARARAARRDSSLEPPASRPLQRGAHRTPSTGSPRRSDNGIAYRLEQRALEELSFFKPVISADEVLVLLNTCHPFYEVLYRASGNDGTRDSREALELLLFAAARAEGVAKSRAERDVADRIRTAWSNALAAFLS